MISLLCYPGKTPLLVFVASIVKSLLLSLDLRVLFSRPRVPWQSQPYILRSLVDKGKTGGWRHDRIFPKL